MHSRIRDILPNSAKRALRRLNTYAGRMINVCDLALNARGVSHEDHSILVRSMLEMPTRLASELDRWKDPTLTKDARLSVRRLGVFLIRARSDDLGHVVYRNNSALLNVISNLVKPADIVVDAGANIGVITVALAKRVGHSGCVVAVEMMQGTAQVLRSNVNLNGLTNVHVIENALSDKEGQIVQAKVHEGVFGQATIAGIPASQHLVEFNVETTTLDVVLKNYKKIALLKMDLEGAEPQALEGARHTISKVEAVLFESWENDGGSVAHTLEELGFQIGKVDGRNFLARRM